MGRLSLLLVQLTVIVFGLAIIVDVLFYGYEPSPATAIIALLYIAQWMER